MSETPLALSYVAGSPTGFHSGSTIKFVPKMLNLGFIDEVIFAPLVRVKRICALSLIPLAARVRNMQVRMKSVVGIFMNAIAFALS